MKCYLFRKIGLFTLLFTFTTTISLAQENKQRGKSENEQTQDGKQKIIKGGILILKGIREMQRESMEKNAGAETSCYKFSAPVFNPFNVTFYNEITPVCHDFPVIDIARDTTNLYFAKSANEYNAVRKFHAGDQLVVLLYINNGADSRLGKITQARNVKIQTTLTKDANLHRLTATYTGDNMKTVAGSVNVQVGSDDDLKIVPNSGFTYSYDGIIIGDSSELNLGNSILNLGVLDAGVEYSLFFSYKIKVVKK